jgi:hypothetical protein
VSGPTGRTGATGYKGYTGSRGPQGPQGPPGSAAGLVNSEPLLSGFGESGEQLEKLHGGVSLLVYGMVGWLSTITIGAIVVFAIVYGRLARASRALDDAETGSSISSRSSRRPKVPQSATAHIGDSDYDTDDDFDEDAAREVRIPTDGNRSGLSQSATVRIGTVRS